AIIDATHGRVGVTAATRRRATRSVWLWGGVARLGQTKLGTLQATLAGDLQGCRTTSRGRPRSRRVWASAHAGLRTYGRYATATPAGTRQATWLTEDRCGSTLVRAINNRI